MAAVVLDIETSGLDYTSKDFKIHCICTMNHSTGEERTFLSHQVDDAIQYLNHFSVIVGHNIQFFDKPVIEHFSKQKLTGIPFDTKVLAAMIFPTMDGHSLGSWGERLGLSKQTAFDYTDFSQCTTETIEQCVRDVRITDKLYRHIQEQQFSPTAIALETRVADIIQKQIERGIRFDEARAKELYLTLSEIRQNKERELLRVFKPRVKDLGMFIPKRDDKAKGYLKDVPFTKIEVVDFNPESNDHIAQVLIEKGWKPKEFTPTGKPKVDVNVLGDLDFPEAKILTEVSAVNKVIGMLSEGDQSWLKLLKNNRLHARVFTTGTITGRMSSGQPNLQQVPAIGKQFGKECRELFIPDPGKVLVGCDAASLELRCLAHYLAKYDNGQFAKIVTEGDIHQFNANILGVSRELAKKFIYAFLYGAGPEKIGKILDISYVKAREVRSRFVKGLPALERLLEDVKRASKKGFLYGLDKRKVYIRSEHAALNTLLQSAGAILMKRAITLAFERNPLLELLLSVHDEYQFQCKPEEVDNVGQLMVQCIQLAGESFGLRCKLDAQYKSGKNWSETH